MKAIVKSDIGGLIGASDVYATGIFNLPQRSLQSSKMNSAVREKRQVLGNENSDEEE